VKALPFAAPPGTKLVRLLGRGSSFSVAIVEVGGTEAIAKRALPGCHHAVGPVERERRVLEQLSHPGLPRLLLTGDDDAGSYLVESLFQGLALPGTVHGSPARERYASALLALLEALHAAGDGDFVHGDPSRANFIALASGGCALIDFGSSGIGDRLPAVGQGTLPYAAPELCRAETAPSQMTDRYAVSVLVAELCGVRLSAHSGGAAALLEIGDRGHDIAAIRASDLSAPVRAALADCLAFQPAARPPSLRELRAALDRVA
jgi:serine/threonine protein kinase